MLTDDQRKILEILADPTSDVRGLVAREREAIRAALDEIEEHRAADEQYERLRRDGLPLFDKSS